MKNKITFKISEDLIQFCNIFKMDQEELFNIIYEFDLIFFNMLENIDNSYFDEKNVKNSNLYIFINELKRRLMKYIE